MLLSADGDGDDELIAIATNFYINLRYDNAPPGPSWS